jgi:hypothetical protein
MTLHAVSGRRWQGAKLWRIRGRRHRRDRRNTVLEYFLHAFRLDSPTTFPCLSRYLPTNIRSFRLFLLAVCSTKPRHEKGRTENQSATKTHTTSSTVVSVGLGQSRPCYSNASTLLSVRHPAWPTRCVPGPHDMFGSIPLHIR